MQMNVYKKATRCSLCYSLPLLPFETRGFQTFSTPKKNYVAREIQFLETKLKNNERVSESRIASLMVDNHSTLAQTFSLFKMALEHGHKTGKIFNCMISALAKAGKLDKAYNVIDEMIKHKLHPTVITYTPLIKACGELKNPAKALQVIDRMESEEHYVIELTKKRYSCLIDALGKSGDIPRALDTLSIMKSKNMQPSDVTYNSLIDAYRKQKNVAALIYTHTMLKEGVKPTVVTLTNLVGACARAGKFSEALSTLELFKKMGIAPNHITYTALIDQLGKNKQIDEAVAVMEAMQADGIKPSLVTYNSLMNAYGEVGQLKNMMDTFLAIRKMGLIPDVISYSTMINHYGNAGDVEKALEMVRIMSKEGRKPNNTMYTSLLTQKIAALGKNDKPKEAVVALHKMIEIGLEPNVKTFGAVLQSLCVNGLLDTALEIIKLMEQHKVAMDLGCIECLLEKLIEAERTQDVKKLVHQAQATGFNINSLKSSIRSSIRLLDEGPLKDSDQDITVENNEPSETKEAAVTGETEEVKVTENDVRQTKAIVRSASEALDSSAQPGSKELEKVTKKQEKKTKKDETEKKEKKVRKAKNK